MHVRDLDLLERSDGGSERKRVARLVGVHVHLHRRRIAHDEQRIAEVGELILQGRAVEPASLDDEDGAIAVARELLVDGAEVQLLLDRRVGDRLAGDDGRNAADDLEQARAAGVDDAGVPEHVEQLRRSLDRVRPAPHDGGDQLADASFGVGLGLLRHLADDRQHRPLDRFRHRRVRRVARAAERPGDRCRVELLRLRDRLCEAADDLREDHARVAAGAHQRGTGEFLRERREIGRGRRVELLDRRANSERQVRAGVAVGDGIDVEIVEPAAIPLERQQRTARKLLRLLNVPHLSNVPHWDILPESAAHFPGRDRSGRLRRRVHCCPFQVDRFDPCR